MPTKIQWADETWNPVTGCTKIAPGCENCYAERHAKRLAGRFGYPKDDPFRVTFHPNRTKQPRKWKKPRRIFVCSMSDIFHQDVTNAQRLDIWNTMASCPLHTFMLLTKRPALMRYFVNSISWSLTKTPISLRIDLHSPTYVPPYIQLGISACDQSTLNYALPHLLATRAAVRFISLEPLLAPIDLAPWLLKCPECGERPSYTNLDRMGSWRREGLMQWGHYHGYPVGHIPTIIKPPIDWVIIGCESGPNRRPLPMNVASQPAEQCRIANVPLFVKQLDVDGQVSTNPDDWPPNLKYQEFPTTKGDHTHDQP